MKIMADDWLQVLLHGVLAGAILFYSLLPVLGLATWHNVVPEHDHLFIGVDHHDQPSDPHGEIAPQPSFNDCVACSSSQPSINVVHLPNPASSSSFFALIIVLIAVFTITIPLSFAERVPPFVFDTPRFILSPLEPPPNINR
jgi:hypothetical protein